MAIETEKEVNEQKISGNKAEPVPVQGQVVKETSKPAKSTVSRHGREKMQEPKYSASELGLGSQSVFGVRKECVSAALKTAGKAKYTISEAKGIVKRFLEREVKS